MIATKKHLKTSKNTSLLWLPSYGNTFVAIITTKKQYDYLIEKNNISSIAPFEGSSGSANVLGHADGSVSFVIVLSSHSYTVACHESVHMAQFIMEELGIPTGVENTEALAYLTEHIFSKCMGAFT